MYLMSASLKCSFSSLRIQRPTSFRMGFPLASVDCSPVAKISCMQKHVNMSTCYQFRVFPVGQQKPTR